MGEKTQARREIFFIHGYKRQMESISQVWIGGGKKKFHLNELLRSQPSGYFRSTNHGVQTYSSLHMTLWNCSSQEQICIRIPYQESTSIQGLGELISGYRWVEQLSAWSCWKLQSLDPVKVFFLSLSDLDQWFVQTKYCGTQEHIVSGQVTLYCAWHLHVYQFMHLPWQATKNNFMQFTTSQLEV